MRLSAPAERGPRSRIAMKAEEGALLLPTPISGAAGGWRLHCPYTGLAQACDMTHVRISTPSHIPWRQVYIVIKNNTKTET